MENKILDKFKILDVIDYPILISDVCTNKIIYLNKRAKSEFKYDVVGKFQNNIIEILINKGNNNIKSILKKYDMDNSFELSILTENTDSLNFVDNLLNKIDNNDNILSKYEYMFKCINISFEYLKSTSELYLVFQPKINTKTLNIVGYEVLTRWKNKEYGYITPEEFIPFFIRTNKIKEFDLFVFENTFKFQEEFIKNNISQQCSINLSVESFNDTDILKNICTLVDKYNIPPDSITIEILEHKGLECVKQATDKINILKNKGFKLSIDDFGTGYSSFSRLYNFDIDELKIAKEFLIDIKNKKKQESILKNIFNLANELNIETVVEGVETEEIFKLVKSIGFSNSQGYFHSKPLKKDDYIKFVKEKLQ